MANDLVRGDESLNRKGIVRILLGYSTRSPLQMVSGRQVFDVFAEDDGGTKGDGSPPSKRARSSSEAAENPPPPLAVAAKGVQMSGSAHDDRPRGDQEYEIHQVVGESGSEYEVTALTKLRLSKASVDPKLVRKYRAERRAATRVRTRWSSRMQNKN
jgi:hypothetical protein